jgi:hypothetical protein
VLRKRIKIQIYSTIRRLSLHVIHSWTSGHYIYHQVLTYKNSTFCPHSAFTCFVWIWEQTAIISLYSINWLVLMTETVCVYSAVRTGSSKKVFITVMKSVYIAVRTGSLTRMQHNLGICDVRQPSTSRQKLKETSSNSQRNVYAFKPNAHQKCNPKAYQHTQKLPALSNLKLSEIWGLS